ncbi:MAG: molybdenum cofactor guanylyltransferase [Spirochaetota bacterium]
MQVPLEMNAYILAGGISSRVNRDKAFLSSQGKYFIDIAIECTREVFDNVYLVGRKYQSRFLSGCYADEIEGIGPMGGLYTALNNSDRDCNFVVGMDYPFMQPAIIAYLAGLLLKKPSFNGCIPLAPDGYHPLFAFYKKSCLEAVRKCINNKNYRITCISSHTKIWFAPLPDSTGRPRMEKVRRNFININNPSDYHKYIKSGNNFNRIR